MTDKHRKAAEKIAQEPDYDKRLSLAAESMGENVLSMIKHILRKHDAAIIEASFEAIEAAVKAEREECAKILDGVDNYANPMTATDCADAIRARGQA